MQSYKGKKVLIFGLGLNDGGLGMAEYFLKQGALVTITDGKSKEQLSSSLEKLKEYRKDITLHLEGHNESDFLENDIIVRNPAIKPNNEYLQIAQKAGKQIEMEMSFFIQNVECPVIGVTGTRGKSTTSTLIYEMLKKKFGSKIFLGGNIGKSAVRQLDSLSKDHTAILELSSFQLDSMGKRRISPNIAVVSNIYQDHLDWHSSMDEYINAKKNIYRYQKENDTLIVNIDNEITKEFVRDCKSNVLTYSLNDKNANYYLNRNLELFHNQKSILKIKELRLKGEHNLYNILAATTTALNQGIDKEGILLVLKEFKGVKGRQELVRELNGIKFYNDTTATTIEAMKVMFNTFGKENKGKIVMIAGGMDKGLDYSQIADDMKRYLKALVLLEGTASEKIYENVKVFKNIYKYFGNFKEAISKAYTLAKKGDMIILCPGGTSFNMFANEFDRGDQYVEYVKLLK